MAQQPSILNNFQKNGSNGYDANQYNHHDLSPQSNLSIDSSMNAVPEHRMVDSQGNVHVNKYYNITRNHNLSNASKMTDISEMPSPVNSDKSSTNNNNHGLQIKYGQQGQHKMSVDSATTNTSRMLWDDFSDRGSVMTANTETV